MNFDGPINGGTDRSGEPGPLIVQAEAGRDILLPDGGWILGAEYVREGGDLVLKGKDGQLVVVRDFFNLATPPDLHTGTGAVINGPLATKLAGPLAPGQYAQAGPQASVGEPIGKVTTAEGTVEATRVDGTKVRLKEGDPVYQGDVVETADDGAVGIEFADQSTFSLGDSGRMVLDEMVYDPGGGAENNSFAMSLVQGTFSFVSGQISKTDPEAMNLNTPVATIGIRGTTIAGEVGGEGNDNSISLLPDPNGSTGEIVITNEAGTVVLNVIGATVTVTSVSQAPPQPTILSPEQLATRYDNMLAINPQQPQAAQPDGQQQDGEQLPQDVLDQLQDIGEQLNEAVQQGLAQARQFQLQLEGFKPFIKNLLKPPQIDPLPFQQKFQEQVLVDYSATTARLGEIIAAATSAEQTASAAEVAAATKTAALANQIIVKATASNVGMSASEAQTLASVITAPLKSLGTAATFAASASSTKESALAAMAAAAKGEPVSEELIAELEAFVGLGTGGSTSSDITRAIAKVEKIVAAAITAADKVLTKSITAAKAAKAAGQDVAAAAKTSAADNYNTEITSALAGVKSSKGDDVSLDELSELVSGVQTQMGKIKTRVNEAGDSESFAAMKSAIGFAELTLQKADETAKAAKLSMSAGLTFDQILGHATTAINAAKEAEAFRKQADDAVDLGQLGSGIDVSAFDEFVRYVGFAPGQSEAEFEAGQSDDIITADEAIAAIEAATQALEAAQDYIDGTAQSDAKKADAVFLGASDGDKGTVAVASDGGVTYTPTARSYADLANGASATDTFYVASRNADGSFSTEAVTVTVTNNGGTLGVSDLSAVDTEGAKSVAVSAATAAAAAAAAVLDARGVLVEKLVAEAVAEARADVLEDASATADTEAANAQTAALKAAAIADGASDGTKGSITIAPDGSLTYTATPAKYSGLASGESATDIIYVAEPDTSAGAEAGDYVTTAVTVTVTNTGSSLAVSGLDGVTASGAQQAADAATAAKNADPTNAVLIADAVLKTQLLANADAASDFADQVLTLWQGAATTARTNATNARNAATTASDAADDAQTDVDNLEAAAEAKLTEALAATATASAAESAASRADGTLAVAQAAAEAQASAALDVAVEEAQEYADLASAAADTAAEYAEIARSWTIIGSADKVTAQAAEDVAVAASAEAAEYAELAAEAALDAEAAAVLSYASQDAAAIASRTASLNSAKAAASKAELAAESAEASAEFAIAASALADVVNPEPVDPAALQDAMRQKEQAADQAKLEAEAKAAAEAAARAAAAKAAAEKAAAEAKALADATEEAEAAALAATKAATKAAEAVALAQEAEAAREAAEQAEAENDAQAAAQAAKKPAAKKAPAKSAPANAQADARLEMTSSRQFVSWLFEANASLAFTTYQSGKVFFVGLQPNGRLSIFERTFNRCMGLGLTETGFFMSSLYQLWRFENILGTGQAHEGYDRAYLPVNGHTTGDLDIHDIAVDAKGRPVFVNTLFSCLATIGERESFVPLWQPPFISKLAAEDRCHLNGLAMVDGRPKYVTAVAATDVADGWRDKRRDGGIVIDGASGEIVASGLSMPHSPRMHGGKLWLLNSGTGEFGFIEPDEGRFQAVAFCPGYLCGLSFHGDFALLGLSKARGDATFSGLELEAALASRGAESQCGLYVIDLRNGDAVHWLRIEGVVEELYDVVFLPGVRRPMAFGFKSDEIRRTLNVGAFGEL